MLADARPSVPFRSSTPADRLRHIHVNPLQPRATGSPLAVALKALRYNGSTSQCGGKAQSTWLAKQLARVSGSDTRLSKILPRLVTLAGLCGPTIAGNVESIVYQASTRSQPADWVQTISLPAFDSSLGNLLRVNIELTVTMSAETWIENVLPSPVDLQCVRYVDGRIAAGPSLEMLAATQPTLTVQETLAPFDGTFDFAGPSGRMYSFTGISQSSSVVIQSPLLLDIFQTTTTTSVELLVTASAETMISPGFNLASAVFPSNVEAHVRLTYTYERDDCNGNLVPDSVDIATGTSADFDGNEFPDECQHDHDHDGIPDTLDPDCIGPGDDQDSDGVLDLCDTISDCNSNQIPDMFESDENHNDILDSCEFTSDCNHNGLPDALDLALGTSADLNHNEVPDECETERLGFFSDCSCEPLDLCTQPDINGDTVARLSLESTCSASRGRLSFVANGVLPNRPCLFVHGGVIAPQPFGLSMRCVGQPLMRLGQATSSESGIAVLAISLTDLNGPAAISAWTTRAFQVLHRSVSSDGPSLTTSSALYLVFCP